MHFVSLWIKAISRAFYQRQQKIEYFVLIVFGFSNLRPDMLKYYSINRSDVTLVPNIE